MPDAIQQLPYTLRLILDCGVMLLFNALLMYSGLIFYVWAVKKFELY